MTDYPRLVFRPEDMCVRDLSVGLRQLRRPELDSHLCDFAGDRRCCARAASGHAAAPPSSVTNSRRRIIRSPRRRGRAASAVLLVRKVIEEAQGSRLLHARFVI